MSSKNYGYGVLTHGTTGPFRTNTLVDPSSADGPKIIKY